MGLDVSWQFMATLFEMLFIGAIAYSLREQIISKIYGVRYKKYIEIDTGRQGYTILDKALNSCSIMGMTKSVNRANIKHNVLYFVSDNAENLAIEDAKDKWQYYCNSEEFDTVYKNKLLQQLLFVLEKNLILIIIVLVGISIAVGIYNAYTDYQMQPKIDFIAGMVNSTYGYR